MSEDRRQEAYRLRQEAAELARSRPHPAQEANGDEARFAAANFAMSFTKGLEHDPATGLVADPRHFIAFRKAIDDGAIDAFTLHVPVPASPPADTEAQRRAARRIVAGEDGNPLRRRWEAPTAGVVFDLEGPDAQAVTMPPAPRLGIDELAYEMAEVYELALLRDEPFAQFIAGSGNANLQRAIGNLNGLRYDPSGSDGRRRKTDEHGQIDPQTAFRGSSPGVEIGPYLSQFLLIGSADYTGHSLSTIGGGRIQFGAQEIDQRVPVARPGKDYMTAFEDWLVVQNGFRVRRNSKLYDATAGRRFIATPRDLATYVHDDALYQAYLNACLILLSMRAPTDPAFDHLSGGRTHLSVPDGGGDLRRTTTGFALYGGPHILTLLTEVATRALKAVRFQKFNNHLRLRPEALAARVEKATAIEAAHPWTAPRFSDFAASIQPTVNDVRAAHGSALLPMAFQEGSPMHPSYGAGHATVAGACVTILKAFFDTGAVLVRAGDNAVFRRPRAGDVPLAYVPDDDGAALLRTTGGPYLTLEGELNKLAANISIGRNMAGVHYFSDYYDSLRMGEAVAIGVLEEQALCYPIDRFTLTVPTFDGAVLRIGRA